MKQKTDSTPPPANALPPAGTLAMAATALAAMLALNAPAMLRSTGLLPFDNPVRAPALRALAPVADASSAIRADRLRAGAERLSRRFLEPPPPAIPEAGTDPSDDPESDDSLDEFLDFL